MCILKNIFKNGAFGAKGNKEKKVIELTKKKNYSLNDKNTILNALLYVQDNVLIEDIPEKASEKNELIKIYYDKCIFKCGYVYRYKENKFNYKASCGYVWSPLLIHYIDVHNIQLTIEFIDFIMGFSSAIEKQKIISNSQC